MGPKRAAELFRDKNPDADRFEVVLYGSLASTGKGHLTDWIIRETLKNKLVDIFFDEKTRCTVHPNTMELIAYKDDEQIDEWKELLMPKWGQLLKHEYRKSFGINIQGVWC